ncbi:MAG: peptidoglycan-binding protein, partial [Methylomonas sp.]
LSLEVLEQIRLLTNLETSKTKLLQIILVGQPELKQMLNRQDLRQLNQRITARYHLLPLSFGETRAYIHHRLTVCKGNPGIFNDRAIRKIYQVSSGIPRIINILCDRALLGAYATNATTVSPEIVDRAAQETLGLSSPGRRLNAAMALVLFGGIAAGLYFLDQYPSLDKARLILSGQLMVPDTASIGTSPSPATKREFEAEPIAEPSAAKVELRTLNEWLAAPTLSLNAAMIQALKVWNKTVPAENQVDCNYMARVGLQCLFDKANWTDLLELDRPAILEFSLPSEEKRYGLLTGMRNGQPVIHFNDDLTFPLAEVQSFWDGYYLMLWKPSRPGVLEIAPQQLSTNVLWLRQQLSAVTGTPIGTGQPLLFDEALKAQVIKFQRQHRLEADGIVGARTFIHLENDIGAVDSPHLNITD